MSDLEQRKESNFMIEQIKERPVNKKKLLRRTMTTAGMAVMFGLIACITFLLLEPIISAYLYPQEEAQTVIFPEETQEEEMDPEEMLTEEDVQIQNEVAESEKQELNISIEDYSTIYSSLDSYAEEMSKSMVTVTGVTSDLDWFNVPYENSFQASGVIVANNSKELLVLTKASVLEDTETILVTFCDGSQVSATIKGTEKQTDLAIVAVSLSRMKRETKEMVVAATLATSNTRDIVGTPVVAIGSPMGSSGSVNYGMITAASTYIRMEDASYKLLTTDMVGSRNASGVLFNLQGGIVGIISMGHGSGDTEHLLTALGITELKKKIEKMSNAAEMAYFGIGGREITEEIHKLEKIPMGLFISDVYMNSPAMEAGLQEGDILISLREASAEEAIQIKNMSDFMSYLHNKAPEDEVVAVIYRMVQDEYTEMEVEVTLSSANEE